MGKSKNKQAGRKNKSAAAKPTKAQRADHHILYQKSVQEPETDVALMLEKFTELRGHAPRVLREDFCGTALLSVEWCRGDEARTAVGVDLCEDTLNWGREHNLIPAGEAGERVTLIHGNVLDAAASPADITCAFNFSYNAFKDRAALLAYFRAAHAGLADGGVLAMDVYGGQEAIDTMEEEREVEGEKFTYVWEQEKFNPITHETLCHIHFDFPDGSRLDRAFTYDWRLWTLPELRELLTEAGFSAVHVYWEEYEEGDEDDEYMVGTGRYAEVTEVEPQQSWIAYVFAEK